MRSSIMSLLLGLAAVMAGGLTADSVSAQEDVAFRAYLESLRPKARAMGIRDMTLDSVFPGLTPNPRVIQLDQNQPGGGAYAPIPHFEPYRSQHVAAVRIGRGRTAYLPTSARLARLEAETGGAAN